MPFSAGFAPGAMSQGGNCLGRVRTCGHFPARARLMTSVVVVRRVWSCSGVKSEGMRTKPSRLRESRRRVLVPFEPLVVVAVPFILTQDILAKLEVTKIGRSVQFMSRGFIPRATFSIFSDELYVTHQVTSRRHAMLQTGEGCKTALSM